MPEHLRKIIIPTADGTRHELSIPETDYGRMEAYAREQADTAMAYAREQADNLDEAVQDLRYEVFVLPTFVSRLVAIGYTEEQAAEVAGSLPRSVADTKVSLREGLASIGYTTTEIEECMEDVPELTEEDIAYAREIMEAWNPEITSFPSADVTFKNDSRLVVFPKVDFSSVTSIGYSGFAAPNFRYIPLLDTSNVTTAWAAYYSKPKLRRIPAFDFSSLVSMNAGLTGLAPDVEYIPPLSFPKAKTLQNLFGGLSKLREIPPVEWTDNVTDMQQAFTHIVQDGMPIPFDGDMKAVNNMNMMLAYTGDRTPGGVDLQGQTLRSKAPVVNLGSLFMNSYIKSLPRMEFNDVNNLNQFLAWCEVAPKVIPDFSNWGSVKDFQYFLWTDTPTERVEGLNYASVTNATNVFFERVIAKSLRYIRIINLGKSSCTYYDFIWCDKWGDNDQNNPDALQSLIDTLITDSYDRAAAGMPAAKINLSTAVTSRLTAEQKAAITAKGFTIV